jgi:hypothetical protein
MMNTHKHRLTKPFMHTAPPTIRLYLCTIAPFLLKEELLLKLVVGIVLVPGL